jgi:hypothetical protein
MVDRVSMVNVWRAWLSERTLDDHAALSAILLVIVILCGAVSAVLALTAGFNSDDFIQLVDLQKPFGACLKEYVTSPDKYAGNFFRPGTRVLLRLLAEVFGAHALPFHAISLVLHGLVCFLLYRLLLKVSVSKSIAFWCAVIFAIHPIHAEPVVAISSMGGLACTACYLGALLAYVGFLTNSRLRLGMLTVGLFTLALVFKEEAVSLPLAAALYWWFRTPRRKRDLQPIAAVLIVLTGYMWWRSAAGGAIDPASAGFSLDPLTVARNALFYLVQYPFPVRTVFRVIGYEHYGQLRELLPPVPHATLYIAGIVVGAAAVVVYLWRRWRVWPDTVRLGLVLTLVVIALYLPYPQSGNRFLYLPSVGLSLAVAAWVIGARARRWKTAIFAVWLIVMSGAAVEQVSTWHEAGQLAERVLAAAERVRIRIPPEKSTVFYDLPVRYYGAYSLSSGFREGLTLRTGGRYKGIYESYRRFFDTRPIPQDALWFRWNGEKFVPGTPQEQ